MSGKDFDLEQLAAYLHFTPDQIQKLIKRGELPGRKVQGQWRFSESEIHHWLENRIGMSSPEELEEVERWFERSAPDEESPIVLADLLSVDAIAIPLESRTSNAVIRDMCHLAANTGKLWDESAMAQAVQAREQLLSTALENGVALLHPRRPQPNLLAESFLALGIASSPLPFGNRSGRLTDLFFLIGAENDRIHLRIQARLSRLISDPDLLEQLRHAESPWDAHQVIQQAESNWND
jgi:PTS system nitrogen regulatory IIA component